MSDEKRMPAPIADASMDNEGREHDMTEDPYNGPEKRSTDSKRHVPNIVISVKNSDNLEEFSSKTFIEPAYIPKLQKWIEKNKFVCEETIDDVKLHV